MRVYHSPKFKVPLRLGLAVLLASTASFAEAQAPARLAPLPGSPYFVGAGVQHNLALAPAGGHLYAVSLTGSVIAGLEVGPAGDLSLAGLYPSLPPPATPGGLVFSPGGERLYLGGFQQLGYFQVEVDGRLSGPASTPAVAPWSNP